MKHFFVCGFLFILFLTSCSKTEQETIFQETTWQRLSKQQQELHDALIEAPHGWRMVYFPENRLFGGFVFLMKFDGSRVTMTSDVDTSLETQIGLYQIKNMQTTALTFSTNNHIHKLADAMLPGLRGTGYYGEFDFLYFGKEGERLKFRTQRKEQYVYFEPATEQDWESIGRLEARYKEIRRKPYLYQGQVTTSDKNNKYRLTLNNRRRLSVIGANQTQEVGVGLTDQAIYFSPEIVFEGKKFDKLNKDGNRYWAIVDGVTFEIAKIEGNLPAQEDYTADINTKISEFVLMSRFLKNTEYTSDRFRQMLTVDAQNDLFLVRITFVNDEIVTMDVMYDFDGSRESLSCVFPYRIENKRVYFSEQGALFSSTSDDLWGNPSNEAIFQKAATMIIFFQQQEKGFSIERIEDKIGMPNNDIYILKSESNPHISFPMWGVPL